MIVSKLISSLLIWSSVFVLFLGGCGPGSAELPTYMKPEPLYLAKAPYTHIYVEVDVMDGAQVPDSLLETLRVFLQETCSKPVTIDVERHDRASTAKMQGFPIPLASLLCVDGPPPNRGEAGAYLHLFCYDGDEGSWSGRKVSGTHVKSYCMTEIVLDTAYGWDGVQAFAVKHEAGHVLGLCRNRAHGEGGHCNDKGCLMRSTPGFWNTRWSKWLQEELQGQLCSDCRQDLASSKLESVGGKLSFQGPFLMRHEAGYSIAMLPGFFGLVPAESLPMFDWSETLSAMKTGIRELAPKDLMRGRGSSSMRGFAIFTPDSVPEGSPDWERQCLAACASAAEHDPSSTIRANAASAMAKVKRRMASTKTGESEAKD